MNRTCFLHVGANKTGSSSIQEALFEEVRDPRFHYVSGLLANGSLALGSVFHPSPYDRWVFDAMGCRGEFEDYRGEMSWLLHRQFQKARQKGRHVVVSAEVLWQSSPKGLSELGDYLFRQGLETKVLVYLRHWIPWAGSLFQEMVKGGRADFVLGTGIDADICSVRARLQGLFDVFGRDRVEVHLFDPRGFPGGCVVRHFCGRIGLPLPHSGIYRDNEAFSLPAVQLRFAFNRFMGLEAEYRRPKPPGIGLLLERLSCLRGVPFRLHSSFLSDWLSERQREDEWIHAHTGLSLSDHVPPEDDPYSVATEADLYRFAPETREWIAEQVGQRVVSLPDGEAAARAIALQVDALRRKPPAFAERMADWRGKVRQACMQYRVKLP
jgi:hypothetical protein